MQHLEVSGAVRPLKWSLGVKWLILQACKKEAKRGSVHLCLKVVHIHASKVIHVEVPLYSFLPSILD